ncbi:MAG: decarboxylating 6-phosphogluconate dehydrogenase [Candidatus Paceibacterota bacterium]|jgi:6-phosphogluconate dehydrogenase
MTNKQIGYVGLGKMGHNMVERLLEKGYGVVAYNRSPEPVKEIEKVGAKGAYSLKELVDALSAPRTVFVMVSHNAVDAVLSELVPLLSHGDTVIDGGNCFYEETMRRAKELKEKGIDFMDAGVSGGPAGARNGAAIMAGGKKETYEKYRELFEDLSAPGAANYMGDHGAGHFVKMVHNGIEYGMMQAIAEGFSVLKNAPFHLDLHQVAKVYDNKSVIESRLVTWLVQAYEKFGPELSGVSGSVAHSGEGQWTVETAKKVGVPAKVIEDSLQFRIESTENPSYTGQVLTALRNMFGGHDLKNGKN